MVHALANSIIANQSELHPSPFQFVQNTIARVTVQKLSFCHFTPVLNDLHWLPIRQRKQKTCLNSFGFQNTLQAPPFFKAYHGSTTPVAMDVLNMV